MDVVENLLLGFDKNGKSVWHGMHMVDDRTNPAYFYEVDKQGKATLFARWGVGMLEMYTEEVIKTSNYHEDMIPGMLEEIRERKHMSIEELAIVEHKDMQRYFKYIKKHYFMSLAGDLDNPIKFEAPSDFFEMIKKHNKGEE